MYRNKWQRSLSVAIAGLWMLGSAPLSATDSQTATDKNAPLARWQSLTPEQRKELLENYHQFKTLTPEKRADLRKRWQEFQSLPPAERTRILAAYRRFKSLSPEKQARIRENWQRWQTLTPEERAKLEAELTTLNQADSTFPKSHPKPHTTPLHKVK
jgi:hypothetical protein